MLEPELINGVSEDTLVLTDLSKQLHVKEFKALERELLKVYNILCLAQATVTRRIQHFFIDYSESLNFTGFEYQQLARAYSTGTITTHKLELRTSILFVNVIQNALTIGLPSDYQFPRSRRVQTLLKNLPQVGKFYQVSSKTALDDLLEKCEPYRIKLAVPDAKQIYYRIDKNLVSIYFLSPSSGLVFVR